MTAELVTFAGSSDNNYVRRLVQETVRLGYRWVWFDEYRIHARPKKQCSFEPFDKTQHAHFWGNPLFQATKQHWYKKLDVELGLVCFWLSYGILVARAWKNVVMTMQCNRRDVMTII